MKKLGVFLSALCFGLFLAHEAFAQDATKEFRYDYESGKCVNATGEEGYNTFNESQLLRSFEAQMKSLDASIFEYWAVDGECVDFRGMDLRKYFYPPYRLGSVLLYWDLRGANLEGVSWGALMIYSAGLVGAHFSTFDFEYLSGYAEDGAVLPPGCKVVDTFEASRPNMPNFKRFHCLGTG